MLTKISFATIAVAALALSLALPVLAQTTATISPGSDGGCATSQSSGGTTAGGAASDCAPVKTLKLGTNIQPAASSEDEVGEVEDD